MNREFKKGDIVCFMKTEITNPSINIHIENYKYNGVLEDNQVTSYPLHELESEKGKKLFVQIENIYESELEAMKALKVICDNYILKAKN